MNALVIWILKVNVAIALFYLFYRLFFDRDTFWNTRRFYLLFSIVVSFVYPYFSIESWLQSQQPMQTIINNYVLLNEFTVTPEKSFFLFDSGNVFWAVYFVVVLVLLIRMFLQLLSIVRIHLSAERQIIQGIKIVAVSKEVAPFSFFRTIYMNPVLHSEKEISQIMTHELTHVNQFHSMDVLISELLCIVFWFNPFVWLLKREIRQNLEFLADNTVINSGFDSRTYQYHLLQLTYQNPELKLTNKFNVLPLKKRIKMMNQQQSEKARILKYLLIVPLSMALIFTSNAESIISAAKSKLDNPQTTSKVVKTQMVSAKSTPSAPNQQSEVVVVGYGSKSDEKVAEKSKSSKIENGKPVFTVVEKMPQFPGGDAALFKYLGENVRYPVKAQENGIQGRVICQYVVNEDGSVSDVSVVRGVEASLDAEAIRVISAMPKWTPGEQKGKAVAVKYTLPISFRLESDKHQKTEVKGAIDLKNPPLIVLDGNELPSGFNLSMIKPEAIEKVEVLKDASATSVYGDKGKNGVILITSKK